MDVPDRSDEIARCLDRIKRTHPEDDNFCVVCAAFFDGVAVLAMNPFPEEEDLYLLVEGMIGYRVSQINNS
jgi:hypothetical protein